MFPRKSEIFNDYTVQEPKMRPSYDQHPPGKKKNPRNFITLSGPHLHIPLIYNTFIRACDCKAVSFLQVLHLRYRIHFSNLPSKVRN